MLVIFDCDGVLVDSEIISAQVLSDCFAEQGLSFAPKQVIERYRGKSIPRCIELAASQLAGVPDDAPMTLAQQERGQTFWRHVQQQTLIACEHNLQAVAGAEAVLQELQARGIPFCVGSNGKHEKMAVTLRKTGLEHYLSGRVFSAEDVAQGKPAPDLFLLAARTLGVDPVKSVVVEDSVTGVRAALAAGMTPFAYCPPDHEDGSENLLLPEMRALGAQCFFSMDELLPLLLKHEAAGKV